MTQYLKLKETLLQAEGELEDIHQEYAGKPRNVRHFYLMKMKYLT